MNLKALVCLCVLSSTPLAFSQQASVTAPAQIWKERIAEQQLSKLPTDDRIDAYQKLVAKYPADAHVKDLLAAAYLQKVRETADFSYLNRAAKIVEQVIRAEPKRYEALRLRNEIELQRHNFRGVVAFSQEMMEIDPSDPGVWGNMGDAYMELGDYDNAAKAYEKMFSLRPSQASYNRAAFFAFVTGRPAMGIKLMQDAVDAGAQLPENTAWCMAELGDMYIKTGNIAEARRAYSEALKLFPNLHRAEAGMGRVETAEGNAALAMAHYKRAQSIVPMVEYAGALAALYQVQGADGEKKQQWDLIDVIDKMGKANGEAANRNLALMLADENRNLDRALELVVAELANRQDVYTYDAQAWVLYRLHRYAEAREASAKALKFSSSEPAFYYHAGLIAAALGDTAESRKDLQHAMGLNPHFDPLQAIVATKMLAEQTAVARQ